MAEKSKPTVKPKPAPFTIPGTRFDKPQKSGWLGPALFFLFVVLMLCAAVWLFYASPKLKPLVCDNGDNPVGLTAWGSCHEAQ